MRRREFITILGGAAAWPVASRGQQAGKVPIIGYLAATPGQNTAAFAPRLRQLGLVEGRTIAIEYRWSGGRDERNAEIAAEFVRLKVDIIVVSGAAVLPAKEATSVIPIVFTAARNPLGTGMIASLAHPGGNATGLSSQMIDLVGKRIELLREIVPGLRRLGILANVADRASVLELGEVASIARTLGFDVIPREIRRAAEIAPAFEALKGRVEALYVVTDPFMHARRT